MSVSIGGLGALGLRKSMTGVASIATTTGDIRSLLCLVIFCIVFLVLAYLTNPSENSFRAYLTEQSFRQHLSCLDDCAEDDQDSISPLESSDSKPKATRNTVLNDNGSPFHFANRASISIRTPRHALHSFAIFTVAAIVTPAKTGKDSVERGNTSISDSWFIGAFGMWWRGGVLEAWYQDIVSRTGDEESWAAGVLGMKTLDRCDEFNALPGLPFSTKSLPPHGLSRTAPPRLRNRDVPAQTSARSSTPPPLPKSATLPLHTIRPSDRAISMSVGTGPSSPTLPASEPRSVPSTTMFDQSPHVVDLLDQITSAKASVVDLRTQISDSQTSAVQTRTILQTEVDSCRNRKRQEDASQRDIKLRTKVLDDSKRAAEASKKEVERRLKRAESTRNDVSRRISFLDNEIASLRARIAEQAVSDASEEEKDITRSLEEKRNDLKSTEEAVTALTLRAKELEDNLVAVKEHSALPDKVGYPIVGSYAHQDSPSSHGLVDGDSTSRYPSAPLPSITHQVSSSKPMKLLLDKLSNFHYSSSKPLFPISRPQYNSTAIDDGAQDMARARNTSRFSPFSESPPAITPPLGLSPMDDSLIPQGLIKSLDSHLEGVSMSFRSESDVRMDRDWRSRSTGHSDDHSSNEHNSPSLGSSRTSYDYQRNVYDSGSLELDALQRGQDASGDLRHSQLLNPISTSVYTNEGSKASEKGFARRWFSPGKALNPDAKVFSFPSRVSTSFAPQAMPLSRASYDALNPNGIGSGNILPSAADSSLLLRAFAPSPAEREALQRALGGSTNTSLERLPSLSDVGTLPSSSSSQLPLHQKVEPETRGMPSWFATAPPTSNMNFSPWDDEEEGATEVNKRR